MAIILQFVPLNWLYWHMHQKHPAAALGMCIVKKRHYQEVTVKYLAESLTYNHTFPEWKILYVCKNIYCSDKARNPPDALESN